MHRQGRPKVCGLPAARFPAPEAAKLDAGRVGPTKLFPHRRASRSTRHTSLV